MNEFAEFAKLQMTAAVVTLVLGLPLLFPKSKCAEWFAAALGVWRRKK